MSNSQKPDGSDGNRTEAENTRTLGTAAGGALFGASVGGLPGALIGGLFGLIVGESVNDDKREKGDK